MAPIKITLKISLSHSYKLLMSLFTSSQDLDETMRYYPHKGIIRCSHNLCVLYDIRIFCSKYRKYYMLFVIHVIAALQHILL